MLKFWVVGSVVVKPVFSVAPPNELPVNGGCVFTLLGEVIDPLISVASLINSVTDEVTGNS